MRRFLKSIVPLIRYIPLTIAVAGTFLLLRPEAIRPIEATALDESAVSMDEPFFSEDQAYAVLSQLVTEHPNRDSQTSRMASAAEWARQRFDSLGLEVYVEEYLGPVYYERQSELDYDLVMRPLSHYAALHPGYNTVAYLPGETDALILVGAHLDVASETEQGAGDNGSGVACVIELARVLREHPRRHSFLFVLFDGEEIGLRGSLAFADAHPELPIRHVLILDSVGRTGDTMLFGGNPVSYRGAGSSDAFNMLAASAEEEHLQFILPDFGPDITLLLKVLTNRAFGIANTDVGAFHGRAESAVAVITGRAGRSPSHTPEDTLDKINPEVLGQAGRAAERYLLAIDQGWLPPDADTSYIIARGTDGRMGFLPGQAINGALIVLAVAVMFALAIAVLGAQNGFDGFSEYLKAEVPILLIVIVGPFLWAVGLSLFRGLPFLVYLVAFLAGFPLAWVAVTILRSRVHAHRNDSVLGDRQRLVLSALALAATVSWFAGRGIASAVFICSPLLLILLPFGYHSRLERLVSRMVALASGILVLVIGVGLSLIAYYDVGFTALPLYLGLSLFTAILGVYAFSYPR
ncbi:MAG: M28 family peptidase [Anaerolineae bacterium]|nr:M28 family peptidase [Anaerolineae bacterium]